MKSVIREPYVMKLPKQAQPVTRVANPGALSVEKDQYRTDASVMVSQTTNCYPQADCQGARVLLDCNADAHCAEYPEGSHQTGNADCINC